MQRLIIFLEKYAEWVVLGAGGLYLLWMAWGMLLNPPVTASVGTKQATPGEVDKVILEGPAKKLEDAMRSSDVPPMEVERFADKFAAVLGGEQIKPQVLAGRMMSSPPLGDLAIGGIAIVEDGQEAPADNKVDLEKIALPPAIPGGIVVGRSTLSIPAEQAAPVDPRNPKAGAVVAVGQPVDKDWATVTFTIPTAQIVQQFADVNVPDAARTPVFFRIEVMRQEVLPDGKLGPEQPVPPLTIQRLAPMPQDGNRAAQFAFEQWAKNNAPDILNPPFYQILRGDIHRIPGPDEGVVIVSPIESREIKDEKLRPQPRVPEERGMDRKKDPRRAGDRPVDVPQVMTDALSPDRNPRNVRAAAPVREARRAPAPPQRTPTRGDRSIFSDEPDERVDQPFQPPVRRPADARPLNPVRPAGRGQDGALDAPQDVLVWAHDTAVEPNRTYQYKLRYQVKNPIWGGANIAKKKEMAQQFVLQSDYSAWGAALTVPPRTYFCLKGGLRPGGTSAWFEVFTYRDGRWRIKAVEAGPGDPVGGPDRAAPEPINYSTGWTVVDIRFDTRAQDAYVLLVDERGRLMKRDVKSDQNDALIKLLREQVAAAPAPDRPRAVARGEPQ